MIHLLETKDSESDMIIENGKMENDSILLAPQIRHILASLDSDIPYIPLFKGRVSDSKA